MSEAGDPPDESDWFGGRTASESADRAPRPVNEAFGHLRRADEEAAAESDGESDWFDDESAAASTPAETAEPDSAAIDPAAETATDSPPESTPEPEGRVRLRALTGGLADLSDALAAIGVESVALRSPGPAHPAPPAAPPVPSAADFRVRCPDCGPQYVAVSDLRFVETGDGAEANRYLFTCPACGARVRRPAGPELAAILKSSGVATLALRRGPGQAL